MRGITINIFKNFTFPLAHIHFIHYNKPVTSQSTIPLGKSMLLEKMYWLYFGSNHFFEHLKIGRKT